MRKLIGGIGLISGTAIGAGMLALPSCYLCYGVNEFYSYFYNMLVFYDCFRLVLFGSYLKK